MQVDGPTLLYKSVLFLSGCWCRCRPGCIRNQIRAHYFLYISLNSNIFHIFLIWNKKWSISWKWQRKRFWRFEKNKRFCEKLKQREKGQRKYGRIYCSFEELYISAHKFKVRVVFCACIFFYKYSQLLRLRHQKDEKLGLTRIPPPRKEIDEKRVQSHIFHIFQG